MTGMIRRILCLALAAVMMAALLPSAVFLSSARAETSLGIVTRDGVNFRVGASMKDRQLFRLAKGTVCPVLSQVSADGYNWFEVTAADPSNGREFTGYVRGDCFRMMTEAEVTAYAQGTGVDVNGNGNNNNNNNNNGVAGDILGYVQTIKGSVNLRASIGGTAISTIGIYVTMPYLLTPVKRGNYTWYYVQVNGVKGYVRGDCVRTVKNGNNNNNNNNNNNSGTNNNAINPVNPVDPINPTGYVTTTMNNVNVRKGIWGDLLFVAKVAGTSFPYYGEPRVSGKTKWYFIKVENYNGKNYGYAYIHGSYVTATETNPVDPTPTPTNTVDPNPVTPDPNAGNKNEATYTTLRPGSRGQAVLNLVRELKNQGYYTKNETKNYNSSVENAVRAFQKAKGLAVDGIAGSKTQHALFNTVPVGQGNRSNLGFIFYPVEKIDWYTGGINELWPRGSNYKIYDVLTGKVWWAHRWAGGLHVDAEPLTAADTAVLCEIYGVSKSSEITSREHWQRRPCLVTIGTRTFACSLYGVPHIEDGDTISNNDFTGQLCIHFTNSKIHGSGQVDSGHQQAIQDAYDWYWGTYTKQ